MTAANHWDTQLQQFIVQGLQEDIGEGDHTSLACIPADKKGTARLLVKDVGVLAGLDVAESIFRHLAPDTLFKAYKRDGDHIEEGEVAFEVTTDVRTILKAERLVLNTLQRMCGIATRARRYADELAGLPTKVLDTRKTTPLLRFLEKQAVRLGGGTNYRTGLYDRIMIKDNHVDAAGGMEQAIHRVREYLEKNALGLQVTVEVRNLLELYKVMEVGGVNRIMFDNFEVPLTREAVQIVGGRFETEASGGITLHTVRAYAKTGVDYVSVGELTHSVRSLDLSLKINKG